MNAAGVVPTCQPGTPCRRRLLPMMTKNKEHIVMLKALYASI
jgi:hypothetical protein